MGNLDVQGYVGPNFRCMSRIFIIIFSKIFVCRELGCCFNFLRRDGGVAGRLMVKALSCGDI